MLLTYKLLKITEEAAESAAEEFSIADNFLTNKECTNVTEDEDAWFRSSRSPNGPHLKRKNSTC